jgi:predicted phage tail protein
MKTVKLLGELGKKFGSTYKFDIANPAEAVRALCANNSTFKQHLIESQKRGVAYKVMVGTDQITEKELHNPSGKNVIKFIPVLTGAGGNGGVFGFIVGAVLIAASFIPSPLSPYLLNAGIAMVIGGVVQMLTPIPSTNISDDNNRPDNKPSYAFNGAVNTSAQGYPVPIGYGRMIVGSAVISAGITVEELA